MSFEPIWLYKSRIVWVEITLFISLTLRAQTNVDQKNGIQSYAEVLQKSTVQIENRCSISL